jgi:hypothetical protein
VLVTAGDWFGVSSVVRWLPIDAGDRLFRAEGDEVRAALGRRLPPAALVLLADQVGAGREVGEGVIAVGVGDGEALAGVPSAVVVLVEVDGPAGQPGRDIPGEDGEEAVAVQARQDLVVRVVRLEVDDRRAVAAAQARHAAEDGVRTVDGGPAGEAVVATAWARVVSETQSESVQESIPAGVFGQIICPHAPVEVDATPGAEIIDEDRVVEELIV